MTSVDPPTKEGWGRKLLAVLLSPFVVAFATVCTIVGFWLGIYQASQAPPKLKFAVKPERLEIVSASQSPRLSVLYKGRPVKGDVTTVRVALWNAGKGPVDGKVRKPIVIYTEPSVPILEASLNLFIDDDVTGMQLRTEQLSQGRVLVVWDELEEGEGASIDLLYNGPPDIKISISGRVRGQKNIVVFQNKIGYGSPMEEYEDARRVNRNRRLWSPVFILVCIAGMGACFFFLKKEALMWKRKALFSLMACLLMMIALFVTMYVMSEDPVPPLSFHEGA